jgi:hypothetical protein
VDSYSQFFEKIKDNASLLKAAAKRWYLYNEESKANLRHADNKENDRDLFITVRI